MYPYFHLFGINLSSYAVMAAIGIVISIAVLFVGCKKFHKSFDDSIYIYGFTLIGIFLGARLLFTLISIPIYGLTLDVLFCGGFVFWGGFIGGWIAAVVAARYFEISIKDYYPVLVPSVAIFAGFGRIGCFLTGCCYGKESVMAGVCYSVSEIAPNGVPLIPIQLFEAAFDYLIAILIFGKKDAMKKYALLYAVFRFFAEFFRGDDIRGHIGIFSVSQFISVVVIIIVISGNVLLRLSNGERQIKRV